MRRDPAALSFIEYRLLRELDRGHTVAQISRRLHMSDSLVYRHLMKLRERGLGPWTDDDGTAGDRAPLPRRPTGGGATAHADLPRPELPE